MLRVCKTCGKEFNAKPNQVKRGGGRFCSVVCRAISQQTRVTCICECCGEEFVVHLCHFKSGQARFCSRKCRYEVMVGPKAPKWKGGTIDRDGYRRIIVDGERISEHRHVMQQYLGRVLTVEEIVHHKDGDPANNDIENLQVMTHADHTRLHHADITKWGTFICPFCGKEFERLLSAVRVLEPCCCKSCVRRNQEKQKHLKH